jgi:hypothetical protein
MSPTVSVATVKVYPGATDRMQEATVTRVGNRIVNAAKPLANVDTGLMRSRIEFRMMLGSQPPQGEVVARTNYSYWVHNGNRRTGYSGNPFLTNAARQVLG